MKRLISGPARSTSARKRRPKDKAVPIRPDSPHLSNLSSELSRFVVGNPIWWLSEPCHGG